MTTPRQCCATCAHLKDRQCDAPIPWPLLTTPSDLPWFPIFEPEREGINCPAHKYVGDVAHNARIAEGA